MKRMGEVGSSTDSAGAAGRSEPSRVRVGACRVEADLDRIVAPHGDTALEPKTMAVLMYLVRHPGRVVSAGELIEVVWLGRPMGDNPVYRCVAQLRRALGDDPRVPTYIATVPTKGYRLIAPVSPLDPEPQPPAVLQASVPGDPEPAPVAPPPASARRRGRPVRLAALGLLLCLTLLLGHRWPAAAPPNRPTLAVLPLQAPERDRNGALLAQEMTDLIHDRLARLAGLTVIASDSAAGVAAADARLAGRRQHAPFLLRGGTVPRGGQLHVDLQLVNASSGRVLWSQGFERPLADAAAIRDEVSQRIAETLGIQPPAPSALPAAGGLARLDAYEAYRQGLRQLDDYHDNAALAVELFRRATILDPVFARAYLELGRALVRQIGDDASRDAGLRQEAGKAFDRALELDPELGEAWIGQARLTRDPVAAEALYRKGLALAPNDGDGHVRYAQFLYANSRTGEAIETIEQARRIDPLAPEPCLMQAFFVMVERSDVAEHDRLVRELLEINPNQSAALYQLAYSNWEFSGRFAEAARLAERVIAVDPGLVEARWLARDIYLDLGDPAAAAAALGPSPPPEATMELAQYRGDAAQAAAALKGLAPADWPDKGPQAAKAQAIRDAAIASGDFASALGLLQSVQAVHAARFPMAYRGYALVHAHTLLLAGKLEQGRRLAQSTLALVDAHGLGRVAHWFSRERAAAFMLLGDDEQALQELRYSVANGQFYRWWYLAEHDPLYARLRNRPDFQALDRLARAHRDRQRALLAAMRRG